MDGSESRAGSLIGDVVQRFSPGVLWGHSIRGFIWNPIFALLPLFYLSRFTVASSSPAATFWLSAFILGFPHAGYTALEIRHYISRDDGVADGRTRLQLGFFSLYFLFGGVLAVWYVQRGAAVISERLGVSPYAVMFPLALAGSVGAVMGLQNVLVMDIALRPVAVLQAAARSLLCWRWLRITLPWTVLQLVPALALHALS